MKDAHDTRRAYRARFNKVRASASALEVLCKCENPDNIKNFTIGDMRALVEDITQCFHEFNAYWNVYHTGKKRALLSEDDT